MEETENCLSILSWYKDIQIKGNSLAKIPENERTLQMCFVAIHYWGAALEYVPDKYKTYEFCLDAVRHNTPVDEGCSALAFVPEELRTYELCLEAVRHDYLPSAFWAYDGDGWFTVQSDYSAAIGFVPKKLRTPELCYEAFIHYPSFKPGYYVDVLDSEIGLCTEKPMKDILVSPELFIEMLKRLGMPDEYNEDALKYQEKLKKNSEWKWQ